MKEIMKSIFKIILFGILTTLAYGINNESLAQAFKKTFNFKDEIKTLDTPIIQAALIELNKMGITNNFSNLCEFTDHELATILMKAAYAEYIIGLNDPSDWSIVVADAESGQLMKKRSFSSTRFAVIESLLLISIVALAHLLWNK
jgi:hypothetical protein